MFKCNSGAWFNLPLLTFAALSPAFKLKEKRNYRTLFFPQKYCAVLQFTLN